MQRQTIQPMKKVSLALTFHIEEGAVGGPRADFSFIVGIGSQGISQFEEQISGLGVGETIRLQPSGSSLAEFMGPQYLPLCQSLNLSGCAKPLLLTVEVIGIEEPDSREVVQQMAGSAGGCGCSGGDCGCGCS